jgi:excisionase family DNA binding protein
MGQAVSGAMRSVPVADGQAPLRRLLTASEVADLLRVGRSTVYEWSRIGSLPCVVLRHGRGRSVRRWEPAAVEAFIAAGRSQPGADLMPALTHGVHVAGRRALRAR